MEGGERRKKRDGEGIGKITWSSQNFPVDPLCKLKRLFFVESALFQNFGKCICPKAGSKALS